MVGRLTSLQEHHLWHKNPLPPVNTNHLLLSQQQLTTMKFTLIALAGALTAANGRQLRNTTPRKLEQNGNNNNQVQLTSASTLTFEKCVDVTTMADEDEDIQAAISAGYAMAEASYVTFFSNSYANDNDRMITTAGNYVAAKVKASANKDRQFCEACEQWQETCYEQQYGYNNADAEEGADENQQQDQAEDGADENQEQNQADGEDGDDAGRKLYGNAPDCGVCESKGCFAEEQEGAVDSNELVGQFVEQVAECMEVEDANGGQSYYIGFGCSPYGDAAELAAYLDDGCSIMTNTKSAASLISGLYSDDGVSYTTLLSLTSTFLQEAFITDSSCYQMQYDDPNEENDGNNNNQNQEEEIAEVCNDIAEEAMYVAYCYVDQQEQQEAAEDEQQAWYDVDVQNADDLEEVCSVVNAKLRMDDGEADWDYFYNEELQGTSYERNKKGQLVGSAADQESMSGGMIFLITALVIAIVVAPIAWFIISKKNKKRTSASESEYQGWMLS